MNLRAQPVVIVAGPTASGKSALAASIAEDASGVVINADSMQVYRELPILSGAPDKSLTNRAPHRLYGALPVADPCSAGRWLRMALDEIGTAHAAGALPVVCGGTGLYLKALTEGLTAVPEVPANVRQAVLARLAGDGPEALHEVLRSCDPATAARLDPTDGQRIARALMVHEATGRALSSWQADDGGGPPAGWRFMQILLEPPRDSLYPAIDARFLEMLDGGALEEVRALIGAGTGRDLPGMKALGVPDLIDHLEGRLPLPAATAAAQAATRQYAKRQITWFRHQFIPDFRAETQFSERINQDVRNYIRQFMLTVAK